MSTQTHTLLAWQAPTRRDADRSTNWYVVGGMFCLTAVAYGVLIGQWSLSLTFGLIAGLYVLIRSDRHSDHSIAVTDEGIEFDRRLQPWNELKEFWILQGHGYYELHVGVRKYLRSDIIIQTGNIDPFVVRDLLGQYLPQTAEKKERILDAIIRFCKL